MRPTLEEQLRIYNATDEELLEWLKPHSPLEFWIYRKCKLLWRFLYWNWFNIWTGENGFKLFAIHKFRDWGVPATDKEG